MSGPYTVADMFGHKFTAEQAAKGFGRCDDPDCEKEHNELPDGTLHHLDCECEDCILYAYLFLK